jgi:hypothetical protein
VAITVVLALCATVFAMRATSPSLLKDTDTLVLLRNVESRHAPLSWFVGDWPLKNHFYRPLSTLTFEADHALYGWNAAGYGATNALLAIGCILMLFWLVRELTDSPLAAGSTAGLFALWHLHFMWFDLIVDHLGVAVLALGIGALLPGRRFWANVVTVLVAEMAVWELSGIQGFSGAIVYWLPGRTASSMTLFALAAMAAYARFERLGAQRIERPLTPITPQAAKRAPSSPSAARRTCVWAVLACVFAAAALGCYEQAVMLPAALFGVAVAMRMLGFRVRWIWQAPFWGLLVAYIALRHAVVPSSFSGYQMQQFRSGPGVWMSLSELVLPCLGNLQMTWVDVTSIGVASLILVRTYWTLLATAANAAVAFTVKPKLPLFLFGWILSVVTFLPMAWLKPFQHYYYWPMAMRAVLTITLVSLTGSLAITGWSRPARQAPPRLDPAPGSLPRP